MAELRKSVVSKVVEAPPEVVEAPPEVVEAPPEVVEAPPEVVEAQPKVVEAPPEVVEAQPKVADAPVQAAKQTVKVGNTARHDLTLYVEGVAYALPAAVYVGGALVSEGVIDVSEQILAKMKQIPAISGYFTIGTLKVLAE